MSECVGAVGGKGVTAAGQEEAGSSHYHQSESQSQRGGAAVMNSSRRHLGRPGLKGGGEGKGGEGEQ